MSDGLGVFLIVVILLWLLAEGWFLLGESRAEKRQRWRDEGRSVILREPKPTDWSEEERV